jgi:hypothetical protein
LWVDGIEKKILYPCCSGWFFLFRLCLMISNWDLGRTFFDSLWLMINNGEESAAEHHWQLVGARTEEGAKRIFALRSVPTRRHGCATPLFLGYVKLKLVVRAHSTCWGLEIPPRHAPPTRGGDFDSFDPRSHAHFAQAKSRGGVWADAPTNGAPLMGGCFKIVPAPRDQGGRAELIDRRAESRSIDARSR